MFSDHIRAILRLESHEHVTWHKPRFYTEPSKAAIDTLNRACAGMDNPMKLDGCIPGIGEVVDIPILAISPTEIIMVGPTWLVISELYIGQNSEAAKTEGEEKNELP